MKWTYAIAGTFILPVVAGCGTNLNEALLLATESGARTLIDVLLSDLYSDLPDLLSFPPALSDLSDDVDNGNVGGDVSRPEGCKGPVQVGGRG